MERWTVNQSFERAVIFAVCERYKHLMVRSCLGRTDDWSSIHSRFTCSFTFQTRGGQSEQCFHLNILSRLNFAVSFLVIHSPPCIFFCFGSIAAFMIFSLANKSSWPLIYILQHVSLSHRISCNRVSHQWTAETGVPSLFQVFDTRKYECRKGSERLTLNWKGPGT